MQREKVADPDIQLSCDDNNIFKWTALIKVSSVIKESLCFFYFIFMCFDIICLYNFFSDSGTVRDSI